MKVSTIISIITTISVVTSSIIFFTIDGNASATNISASPGVVNCIIEFSCSDSSDTVKIYYATHSPVTTSDTSTYIDPSNCNYGNRINRKMLISGLKENTVYYYRIYDTGTGNWYSSESSFTTLQRFTTQYADEFCDMYLIDQSENVSIIQEEGVKNANNPLIVRTFGTGYRGLAYSNVLKESDKWRCWSLNRSKLNYLEYFESNDGISWTFISDVAIQGQGSDPQFFACIINESGTYFDIHHAGEYVNVANCTTPGDDFVVLDGGYHVIDATSVLPMDGHDISSFFVDTLSAAQYWASGQNYAVGSTNERKCGRFIGFNKTDWLYFTTDLKVPCASDETGTYSDQLYHFEVDLRNGVYYGFQQYYNGSKNTGIIETYLVVSRNGTVWEHIPGYKSTMIIPLGAEGEWDDKQIYAGRTGFITENDTDYIYYVAYDNYHNATNVVGRVGRIEWRKYGITSIRPSSSSAWFRTTSISKNFTQNFTLNGEFDQTNTLKIEVLDASTNIAFTDFSYDQFTNVTTNSTDIKPTWGTKTLSDIPKNKDFKLNFSFSGENGILYSYTIDSYNDSSHISILSINSQANNTILYNRNRTIKWTKINNAIRYQLQISNSSTFDTTFVNISNINETNYPDKYTEYSDYVEFILPDAYKIEYNGYHYYRVRAYA